MNGGSPLGAFFGALNFQVSPAQLFTAPLEALVEIQEKHLLPDFSFTWNFEAPLKSVGPDAVKPLKYVSHLESVWEKCPIWTSLPHPPQGSVSMSLGWGGAKGSQASSWGVVGLWLCYFWGRGEFGVENVRFFVSIYVLNRCNTTEVCWNRLNCILPKTCVEILTPSTSECALIWK